MKQFLAKQVAKAMSIAVLAATLTMTLLTATAPPAHAYTRALCLEFCQGLSGSELSSCISRCIG